MAERVQLQNPAPGHEAALPAAFMAGCALAFVAGVSATACFCRSMCCDLEMPGGWTMSMMWMRRQGQTWFASGLGFLLMWLAMMVAMMLPSAVPTFLKTKRAPVSLFVVAAGYFAVWIAVGVGIYALGVEFAAATRRWDKLSRAIPLLSGAALMATGAFQLSRWKMNALLRCRSACGGAGVFPENETSFRLGCKQGAACCLCSGAPMIMQLVLGMMNPLAMIAVAVAIAAEKILPRPDLTARLVGTVAIAMGVVTVMQRW